MFDEQYNTIHRLETNRYAPLSAASLALSSSRVPFWPTSASLT